jgi:hypothetical protein
MEKPSGIRLLLAGPWAQPLNTPEESGRKDKNRSAIIPVRTIPEGRRQPRFEIEVDITINSRTCGMLKGHTVDISESGVAAMLRIEAPLGEVVELDLTLPCGPVKVQAIGRQRKHFATTASSSLIQTPCTNSFVAHVATLPLTNL